MGRKRIYSDEERVERNRMLAREHSRKKRETMGDEYAEFFKDYRHTKQGRASMLLQRYKERDKQTGRGECTLTSKWIIENIFTGHCIYCGETDWHKLGCNRLDNSKPHTIDNVVCCCGECNVRLH